MCFFLKVPLLFDLPSINILTFYLSFITISSYLLRK